ncbi:MAG: DUF5666 domain-containing protein [Burkholderiales bacterium]|nr:DUF5666 domain-containing protein [Burkholderiales bacterium]
MKNKRKSFPISDFAMTLALVAGMALLGACGGGGGADTKTGFGGTGDPTPPATTLTAAGPLSAVGIAAIGATGLDDRASAIFINTLAGQSFNTLKLGMVAEVAGSIPASSTSTTAGTATNIIIESAIVGPVSAVDIANQRILVPPLTVHIDQNTVFEGLSSLANLNAGARVEVYGLPMPESKTVLATRLISLPTVAGAPVELVGTATNVSAFQFTVQGVAVSTANLFSVTTPSGVLQGTSSIVENTRVRALGNYSSSANTMAASQVVTGIPVVRNDNTIIVLDGVVQSVGTNGRFRLSDTDVETTTANAANATIGARIQVKGQKTAGVLVASDFRRINVGERIQYVVQGDIANFVSSANFTVRGETINASAATFVGGSAANLVNGRAVRIKAQVNAGRLEATEVSFVVS